MRKGLPCSVGEAPEDIGRTLDVNTIFRKQDVLKCTSFHCIGFTPAVCGEIHSAQLYLQGENSLAVCCKSDVKIVASIVTAQEI